MIRKWISGYLLFSTIMNLIEIQAQENSRFQLPKDVGLIVRLKNMKESVAPFVSHNLLFFTYKGNERTRTVGVTFASKGFSDLNMLERNAHNVFIYAIPIPKLGHRIAYRYWVDGLWQHDPVNPNYYLDSHEVKISVFDLPDTLTPYKTKNPIVIDERYDFYVYFAPGEHVYMLSDFNNWDPFISPLKEISPGKYYIGVQHLQPGEYQYYFGVGGKKYLDPENHKMAINNEGEKVSIFTVNSK